MGPIEKGESRQFKVEPGTRINLANAQAKAVRYEIDYEDFGTITIEAIPGSRVELKCGTKAPKISIFDADGHGEFRLLNPDEQEQQ